MEEIALWFVAMEAIVSACVGVGDHFWFVRKAIASVWLGAAIVFSRLNGVEMRSIKL
jgi:hypothetical protein